MAAEDVVFRTDSEGIVIALFPDEWWGGGLVSSFEHVGQHGGADYEAVMSRTRPSTPKEIEPLKRELESPPYEYVINARSC